MAGGSVRVDEVTVAELAARPAVDVPRIRSAAVTARADHVGLTGTLSGTLITLAVIRGRTGLRYRPL